MMYVKELLYCKRNCKVLTGECTHKIKNRKNVTRKDCLAMNLLSFGFMTISRCLSLLSPEIPLPSSLWI